MSVGQGRGRRKKKECVFVDVSKSVSSCLWREDGGKNSLAPLSSSDRKTAAGREEGREGKMEREGEGEGLVWSMLKVLPQHAHSHRCTEWAPSEDCGKMWTNTHTVLPHLQINSSFHCDLLNWTEDNIWASQVLKCWRKQRPLRPQSFIVFKRYLWIFGTVGWSSWMNHFSFRWNDVVSQPLDFFPTDCIDVCCDNKQTDFYIYQELMFHLFSSTDSFCFFFFFFKLFLTSVHWSTITSTWNISLFWNFIGHTFPFRLCCLFCIFSSPFHIVFMWAHLTYHFVCYQIQFV